MNLAQLKLKLGYEFRDTFLLRLALRHRSLGKDSNERLEFLGDAVLNFAIAAELFSRHPKLKEGELSRIRANLVNGEVLAELANELGINEFIQVSKAELKSRSNVRNSILTDSIEAIIGAIYLDGGFEFARQRILSWYEKRLLSVGAEVKKDAKTVLQELLQADHLPLPNYSIAKVIGASHDQTFYIECRVPGFDIYTMGVGVSKRKGEQDAAEKFLQQYRERKKNA